MNYNLLFIFSCSFSPASPSFSSAKVNPGLAGGSGEPPSLKLRDHPPSLKLRRVNKKGLPFRVASLLQVFFDYGYNNNLPPHNALL